MLSDTDSSSPDSLYDLAANLRKLANQIIKHADSITTDAKNAAAAKKRRKEIRADLLASAQKVVALIASGIAADAAYAQVLGETGYSKDSLQAAVSVTRRKHREERDIVIAWLSQAGFPNTEIAKIVNLHPVNVSKLKPKVFKKTTGG